MGLLFVLFSCEEDIYGNTHVTGLGWIIFVGLAGIILILIFTPVSPEELAKIQKTIDERKIEAASVVKKFDGLEYKGGHPDFAKPRTTGLEILKDGIRIRSSNFGHGGANVKIDKDDIVHVSFEEKGSRSVGKTAVGAVVGGVLTGGLGLIAGGALGAMKKDVSNLYITIKYHNREYDVIIKAGKKAAEIYGAIANIL